MDWVGRGWEVRRPSVARFRDARMALETVDALDDMRAMLEGVVLFLLLETEHLGAGSRESCE